MVYNPVISGAYTPSKCHTLEELEVYNPVISGFYTPDTGIFSSPKVLVSPLT
jgi:hypothetical protein